MSKLHPLHSADMVADFVRNTGEYFPAYRRTGRSTAQALEYIALAIKNPRTAFAVVDHHGGLPANRHLLDMCARMVHALGFEHFQFNHARNTICFGEPVK